MTEMATENSDAYWLTYPELMRVLDLHCVGDGASAAYKEGWSDARVAKETGVPMGKVANVRFAIKGRIKKAIRDEQNQDAITQALGELVTLARENNEILLRVFNQLLAK